jgi:hypothetical protein
VILNDSAQRPKSDCPLTNRRTVEHYRDWLENWGWLENWVIRLTHPMVDTVLSPLVENGEVAACALVDLELFSLGSSPGRYLWLAVR